MKTMTGGESSLGRKFQHELELALQEFALRAPLNPLRRFYYWDPVRRRAIQAGKNLMQVPG